MELRVAYIPEHNYIRKRRAKRRAQKKPLIEQEVVQKKQKKQQKKTLKKKQKTPKKIAKTKKIKKNPQRKKKIKEQRKEREHKLQGQLLKQLTMVQERIDRMDRDKELYYMLGYEKNDKDVLVFTIMKRGDDKKLKIRVHPDQETNCSCLDWRTRCKKMGIACKHLYYLMHRMLNYSLYEYYDNKIMDWKLFKQQVKKRMRMNDNFEVTQHNKLEEEICPICFMDFKGDQQVNIKQCPDCKNLVHKECMKIWVQNSI